FLVSVASSSFPTRRSSDLSTFGGVHGFQVHHVADHVVFVADAVAAVHVTGHTGDLQSFAAVVALEQGDGIGNCLAGVHQTTQLQGALQAQGDLGLHVGQFLLDQLIGSQGTAKLLTLQSVIAGSVPAELSGTQGAPGNPVAGLVQAAQGAFQTFDFQAVLFRNEYLVHKDGTGLGGTQGELAFNLGCIQALGAALDHKTVHYTVQFRPNHADIGDGCVGDPGFGTAQQVAAVYFLGAGFHAAGVGAVVRFSQAEAADVFTGSHFGQDAMLSKLFHL